MRSAEIGSEKYYLEVLMDRWKLEEINVYDSESQGVISIVLRTMTRRLYKG
ncbi:MAG: hypothetical protein ACLU80_17555 [Dorea sp.]